jgi:hypothetical protein
MVSPGKYHFASCYSIFIEWSSNISKEKIFSLINGGIFMMKIQKIIFLAFILMVSCSKKDSGSSSSSSSPVPSMVTIAKASLPSTLESSSTFLTVDANLTELKDRIFSPGPTDFLYRLKKVDDRLDSLADAIIECEGTSTSTYTPPTIATGFSFPMKLACKQVIDSASQGVSDHKVYFGNDSGYWYIAELSTNTDFDTATDSDAEPPTIGVLAKVSEAGDEMEVYQISVEKKSSTYYSTVTHIKANKTLGIFELSTASSADSTQTISPGANFSGVGCGVDMKTDGTHVYASGKFSQDVTCPSVANVCALASDLTDATGACGSLTSISTLSMGRSDISGNLAKSLVVTRSWLSGL